MGEEGNVRMPLASSFRILRQRQATEQIEYLLAMAVIVKLEEVRAIAIAPLEDNPRPCVICFVFDVVNRFGRIASCRTGITRIVQSPD